RCGTTFAASGGSSPTWTFPSTSSTSRSAATHWSSGPSNLHRRPLNRQGDSYGACYDFATNLSSLVRGWDEGAQGSRSRDSSALLEAALPNRPTNQQAMGAEKPDGPLDRQLQGSPLCQVLGCSTEADFMQPLRDKVTGLVMPGRLFLCSAHYLVLL